MCREKNGLDDKREEEKKKRRSQVMWLLERKRTQV